MVDPINYSAALPQLDLSPLQRGLQMRQANQDRAELRQQRAQTVQLAQDEFAYDQQKDADYLAAVAEYEKAPSPDALRSLRFRFPEQSEKLGKAGDSYSAAAKQDLIGASAAVLGAIGANNAPLAIATLKTRRQGLANSGVDTGHTDAIIQMLEKGDLKGASGFVSRVLGGLVGEDHAAAIWDSLGVGARAEDRAADNERAERNLERQERRDAAADRRAEEREARADRREARADRREERIARGGTASDGNYEYRIDPKTGAVQRRRIR